jgi:hypothetical protein
MKSTPSKIAVTGVSWCKLGKVYLKLDRTLRTTPGMTLVTQPHFLPKVKPWAAKNKVPLECVEATNRYVANEQLLAHRVAEILVFDQDRFLNHLVQVARSQLPGPHIRQYNSE